MENMSKTSTDWKSWLKISLQIISSLFFVGAGIWFFVERPVVERWIVPLGLGSFFIATIILYVFIRKWIRVNNNINTSKKQLNNDTHSNIKNVNDYNYHLDNADIKNETMRQLNNLLLEIDYNHYTKLYIKSNPDWKNSENNSIEKLADAIVYKHLIKMLKDQDSDDTNTRDKNIDKLVKRLILEEEQDYDVIIQSVIKCIGSKLDGIQEADY